MKLMFSLTCHFRFSIFVIENMKSEWQCSRYLELNPTCDSARVTKTIIPEVCSFRWILAVFHRAGVNASIVMLWEHQSRRTRIGTKFSKTSTPYCKQFKFIFCFSFALSEKLPCLPNFNIYCEGDKLKLICPKSWICQAEWEKIRPKVIAGTYIYVRC